MPRIRALTTIVALAPLLAVSLAAQQPAPPPPASTTTQALASRALLEQELARLEREGQGTAAAATLIRARLAAGDFQLGDQIWLRVEGDSTLTDTFTVTTGPALELPQIPAVPLGGVLRSELQNRMAAHLGQYLRDPVVAVRPLMRLLVEGNVGRPGFYSVEPTLPLAEVFTAAGGFTQQAKPAGIRIERGDDRIWSGTVLHQALGRGATVDQLNLRAGDRLYVPARGDSERTLRMLGIVLSIPVTVFALTRVF